MSHSTQNKLSLMRKHTGENRHGTSFIATICGIKLHSIHIGTIICLLPFFDFWFSFAVIRNWLTAPPRRAISCLVYCSTPTGLNLANFEIFTGVSPILLKQYRSSTHQFELKLVAASVIPPQERKSFHLFFLKHLNVDLKTELFLLQWIWFYFLKSTYIYKQFFRVLHS